MADNNPSPVWVVTVVHSGVPVAAEVYSTEAAARQREEALRSDMRVDYDEVGLFEAFIDRPIEDYDK